MNLSFTKMHGAGNDFVVIDGVRQNVQFTAEQWRFIADRHFGVGADQILLVEPPSSDLVDFSYRIFNSDGNEVEHCGNGARCFVRFVNEQGLSDKHSLRVQTKNGLLTLTRLDQDNVVVDMGAPRLQLEQIPFNRDYAHQLGLQANHLGQWSIPNSTLNFSCVSMGNPHAVIEVPRASSAPLETLGPLIQNLECFTEGVNVGFMQVMNRHKIALRVYERGVGETFACGTGACAAVVAGIMVGTLDSPVTVLTRGGELNIEWAGSAHIHPNDTTIAAVKMTGPTQTVFSGQIEIPHNLTKFYEQVLP
jgi:diaminopimelate epimerase